MTDTHANSTPRTHPRTDFADTLTLLERPASAMGYRMPAEWEPMAALWVTPPHNEETWPGCLDQAQAQFDTFMVAASRYVTVRTTQSLGITTNDSWIRDYGPIFVVRTARAAPGAGPGGAPIACHDFHFDGWGGKYEVRDSDDVVPQYIARELNIPLWIHDITLEGGSIEVNGRGTVMTTRQCLLNENRNAHLTQQQIEAHLHEALGTRHIIWLPGGIEGDDTDGHIDDVARFIDAQTVVAVLPPEGHPDRPVLEGNWRALDGICNESGEVIQRIALPSPPTIYYDYPGDQYVKPGRYPLPASYANFVIANGAVLLPVFGQPTDDQAARVLDDAMPGHTIVPIRSEHLIVGQGALHCLTQQQPAG